SIPTISSSVYTGQISVVSNVTIRAMAMAPGMSASRVHSASYVFNAGSGAFMDARDGQMYPYVKIGSQTWMGKNLNYKVDNSWCYQESEKNCETYGRLYQWSAVMGLEPTYNSTLWRKALPHQGICPSGWHVPSDAELTNLTDTLMQSTAAVKKLKANSPLWNYSPEREGTDDYGFSLLPAGYKNENNTFISIGHYACLWSASEVSASNAWPRYINGADIVGFSRNSFYKFEGLSLRCIRDN
ncbi:MAG: hypothetical protein RL318_693, partial [Fibrobacterota bacterium]